MNSFWELDLGRSHLQAHAAELGSDVPFFLHGGLALGIGRGDEVFPLPDLDPMGVVILFPEVQIPTNLVYGMLGNRLTWCRPEANVYAFTAGLEVRPSWKDMFNDLQAAVLEGWPVVGEAIRTLRDTDPLRIGVSGSGGAVFGLYPDRAAAEQVGEVVRDTWRIHVGRTLGRAEALPTVRRQEG
jgi:4-diphosphocytidyl-2-C-methyl-D-erythritol kinase